MYRTVNSAFKDTLTAIELNPTRVELASQRYNSVKAVIEGALPGKTVTRIGSFQRHTKIRPQDLSDKIDLDVLVSWGDAHRIAVPPEPGVTPVDALTAVQNALRDDRRYEVMRPRPDAPTVVLKYADDFCMELVPAFVDRTGLRPRQEPWPRPYLVPTATGQWVPADYDYDADVISLLNQDCGGDLVPTIKLAKRFCRNHGLPVKSFHIEVVCATELTSVLKDWNARKLAWGYQHALAQFLGALPAHISTPRSLQGSYSPVPTEALGELQRQQVIVKIGQLASLAARLAALSDSDEVLQMWHDLYGEPFPTN
jgi:hypothetical protein